MSSKQSKEAAGTAVANKEVVEYLEALRSKWDVVIEHPDKFWEVVIKIASEGEAMPDVLMECLKDEYKRSAGQLLVSMNRAIVAVVKKTRSG